MHPERTDKITSVIISVIATVFLVMSLFVPVYAEPEETEEDTDIPEFEYETSGLSEEDLTAKLTEVEQKMQKTYDRLKKVEKKVADRQSEVDELQSDISEKTERVRKIKYAQEENEKEISERQQGLNERLRAMYTHGFVGYIDVMLTSDNVADFMDNAEMLSRIYKHDRETLNELVERRFVLEAWNAQAKHDQKDINIKKNILKKKTEELEELQAKLEEGYEEILAEEDALIREISAISEKDEIEVIGKIINLYNEYHGGKMLCPVEGSTITWEYMEKRSYERHPGIDLACPTGTPVRAAANGIVVKAGWYGGYGKCVVISHGSKIST